MKAFFIHIIKITLLLLLVGVILDVIFTAIISQSKNRFKIEHVINSKNKIFDVVIMGTSRANNHFVPDLFEKKGLQTFNFGMSGSHLFETSLLLKLMLQNNYRIKTLLLESDLSMCNEKRDEGTTARFMPYLHQNKIIKEHYKNEQDFFGLYYIPFYRYIKFQHNIGVREMIHVITDKKTNSLENKGYYPLYQNNKGNMSNKIQSLKPLDNKYYKEIKKLCRRNNIKLIVVTTPMCKNTKGIEYFDKVVQLHPEIHNFENFVTDDKYFSSCGHLNDEGARIYTQKVIDSLFKVQ